jgi:hypothetical protein
VNELTFTIVSVAGRRGPSIGSGRVLFAWAVGAFTTTFFGGATQPLATMAANEQVTSQVRGR